MIQKKITIDNNGGINIPAIVSMKPYEIAELFEVYVQSVYSGIRTILRSGIIRVDSSENSVMIGKLIMPESYGLEMIVALAFRIDSPNTKKIRDWIIRNLSMRYHPQPVIDLIPIGLN